MSQNLYKCNPTQTEKYAKFVMSKGLVPYVRSSPGIGKSSIFRAIAKAAGLYLIDHRLSTSAPEDLTGLPRFLNDSAEFVPFTELFPIEGMSPPPGYKGWLLFFDEFNAAERQIQAACYKIILDREVGQKKLHPDVHMALAGNLDTDGAITNPLSTAMQSRVIHIEMESHFDSWLKNVAIPENYDARIIAFLSMNPKMLNDFRGAETAKSSEKTFACSRTWEFMNKLIKGEKFKTYQDKNGQTVYEMDEWTPLYAGTITSGVAVSFVQFTKVAQDIPTIEEIFEDPTGSRVPTSNEAKWMIISLLMEATETEKDYEQYAQYVLRFDLSFQVLYFRGATRRNPKLLDTNTHVRSAIAVAEYLS